MVINWPTWDNLESGTKITQLVKHPDYKQIFMFSSITWNRHLIHYNGKWAQKEGHRDVVVQRALLGNYLAQCITNWIGNNGKLCRLEWKVLHSAFAGDELTCDGEVVEKTVKDHERIIECNLQILNQNHELVVSAKAQVTMHT